MSTRRKWRGRAATSLLVVACAAGVVLFLPANLGGSTTFLTTHGTSMEPSFHTGDLAVIKPVNDYRVGDVVAYRSHQLHTVVMHRIVKVDGLHYVFKGDHNSWKDPEHPTRADLVGKLWIHVPQGGEALATLHRAWVFVLAGGLFLFTGTTGLVVRRRRRRKRRVALANNPVRPRPQPRRRQRTSGPSPARAGGMSRASRRGSRRLRVLAALEYGAGIALVVCLVVGTLAWARVSTKYVNEPIAYADTGAFSYSAPVSAGPVYSDGNVHTGDAVYLRILNKISVRFGYQFTSPAAHDVSGTMALSVDVRDTSGWHQTVPLVPATPFARNRGHVDATLDVSQIQGLVAAASGATGVRPTSQSVTLLANVESHGRVGGRPVVSRFSPRYDFLLDPLMLKPAVASTGTGTAAPSSEPSARDSVDNTVRRPATIGLFGVGIDVALARWIGLGGTVLALLVLLVVLAKRRPLHRNEVARIDARDGHIIVPVSSSSPGSQRVATVDVTTMPDLVRLAERYDRLILHQSRGGTHVYLFEAEGIVYRYSTQDLHRPAGVPEEPAAPEAPEAPDASRWSAPEPATAVRVNG
jgi:signal peptidase I